MGLSDAVRTKVHSFNNIIPSKTYVEKFGVRGGGGGRGALLLFLFVVVFLCFCVFVVVVFFFCGLATLTKLNTEMRTRHTKFGIVTLIFEKRSRKSSLTQL